MKLTHPTNKAILLRIEKSDQAILGILLVKGEYVCSILEDPKKSEYIPAAVNKYYLERTPKGISKFGECFTVMNVDGKTNVRVHWGNTEHNTTACLITGFMPGYLEAHRAIKISKTAFKYFMTCMHGINKIPLDIIELFGDIPNILLNNFNNGKEVEKLLK